MERTSPTKGRFQFPSQHPPCFHSVRPCPKLLEGSLVHLQQVIGPTLSQTQSHSQPCCANAILDSENAGLVLVANITMSFLCSIWRNCASLFCKGQVRIARKVSFLHFGIARKISCDSKFLLRPIHISQGPALFRLDQTTQPRSCAKNKLSITRLIPSRLTGERREHTSVSFICANL